MNAALRELLRGASGWREAAHLITFFLGCFSQYGQSRRLACTSAALQANDLIAAREDLFYCCTLVLIQSNVLLFGSAINHRPRALEPNDRLMCALSVDHLFEVRPLHLQHALCGRFSWTLLPDDPDKLSALLP